MTHKTYKYTCLFWVEKNKLCKKEGKVTKSYYLTLFFMQNRQVEFTKRLRLGNLQFVLR